MGNWGAIVGHDVYWWDALFIDADQQGEKRDQNSRKRNDAQTLPLPHGRNGLRHSENEREVLG